MLHSTPSQGLRHIIGQWKKTGGGTGSVFSAFVIENVIDFVIDDGALSIGDIKIPQHH